MRSFRQLAAPTLALAAAAATLIACQQTVDVQTVESREESALEVPDAEPDPTPAEPRERLATVSGVAVDDNARPLAGVVVVVNEVSTRTGDDGTWTATVADSTRIVATFKKPGYVTVTHVSDRGELDVVVTMPAAQRIAVGAPTRGFTVTETRRGASVTFPADALVSARGARPTGRLLVDLYTYDVGATGAPQPPGDGAARLSRGADASVDHVATLYMAITDDTGISYALISGKTATAHIPVGAEMRETAAANPSAATAVYDTALASWMITKNATLNAGTGMYDATVDQVGSWDVGLATSGLYACALFRVNRETTMSPTRVELRSNGGGSYLKELNFTDYNQHQIFRLQASTVYELWIYAGTTLLQKRKIASNTGGATPYPSAAYCTPYLLSTEHPRRPKFLSLPTDGTAASATAYYAKVDPTAARTTLANFRIANGISGASPGVNAKFFNKNELGLGRDLTCHQSSGGDLACYLRKYGHPGDPPAVGLHDMFANVDAGDTVAMEYSPVPNNGTARVVKFYVFGPDGARKLSTPFDTQGEKFVPNVCMGCHGGAVSDAAFPTPASAELNAAFVPVDPSTHVYSGTLPRSAQEESLRKINAMVHTQTSPQSQSPRSYIESMYPAGVDHVGAVATEFVPQSYVAAGKQSLYTTVVKPYCQLCHMSRPQLDWTNYNTLQSKAGLLSSYICPQTKTTDEPETRMPHGFVPFRNLWQGPLGLERTGKLLTDLGQPACAPQPNPQPSGNNACDPNVCSGEYANCSGEECYGCVFFCSNNQCNSACGPY